MLNSPLRSDLQGESEHDLSNNPAVACGNLGQLGAGQRLAVGGQQGTSQSAAARPAR